MLSALADATSQKLFDGIYDSAIFIFRFLKSSCYLLSIKPIFILPLSKNPSTADVMCKERIRADLGYVKMDRKSGIICILIKTSCVCVYTSKRNLLLSCALSRRTCVLEREKEIFSLRTFCCKGYFNIWLALGLNLISRTRMRKKKRNEMPAEKIGSAGGLRYVIQTMPFNQSRWSIFTTHPVIGLTNTREKKANCALRLFLVRSFGEVHTPCWPRGCMTVTHSQT